MTAPKRKRKESARMREAVEIIKCAARTEGKGQNKTCFMCCKYVGECMEYCIGDQARRFLAGRKRKGG